MAVNMSTPKNVLVEAYEAECKNRRVLPHSAFVTCLRDGNCTFTLRSQQIGDDEVIAIATMLHFSNVTELVLREIRLKSDTWLEVLRKCSQMPLKVVLTGCKLGECNQNDIANACGELQASHLGMPLISVRLYW